MTSLEYMQKKNKLVEKVTGKILVPDDQLINVPYSEHFIPRDSLKGSNCPYCNIYYNDNIKCSKCPMYKDNYCIDVDSTYYKANILWRDLSTNDNKNELLDLGEQYKRSNQ